MISEFTASYDGKVLLPKEPLDLLPNVEYVFRVAEVTSNTTDQSLHTSSKKKTLWDIMEENVGCIEGMPADWSSEHNHYLHGAPKTTEVEGQN